MSTTGPDTQFNNHTLFKLILDASGEDEPLLFDQLPELILTNVFDHLSFIDMIKLYCSQPEYANKLMKLITLDNPEPEFTARTSQYYAQGFLKEIPLVEIAKVYLPFAQKIIDDYAIQLGCNIPDFQLVDLGKAHLSIAQQMMQRGKITEDHQYKKGTELSEHDIFELGVAHPEIARELIEKENFSPKVMASFAIHPFVCDYFVKNKTLLDQLENSDLQKIGEHNLEIAEHILTNQDLCNKLSWGDLLHLGMAHQSIAEKIISNETLLSILGDNMLAHIAAPHPELAEKLLSNEALRNRMLSSSRYCLEQLGSIHSSITKRIMQDPNLKMHLREKGAGILLFFSERHPEIAQQILSTEDLKSQLSATTLVIYACKNIRLAEQILDDETLSSKLTKHDLRKIVESYPNLLERYPEKFQQDGKPLLMLMPIMMRFAKEIHEERKVRPAPTK